MIPNPDKEFFEYISAKVKENGNYCPCSILKNDDTKCICKEFRESKIEGYCHCQRYLKYKHKKEEKENG
ncbi:MAG: hypothetical protein HUJ68_07540 [Clostridia bacterium]|nr:hypothetical protein [Clostridia bacterium]